MKRAVTALVVGVVLGGTSTALAVTKLGRYQVPHGYVASFVDSPKLACANKSVSESMGPTAPAGSIAVVCFVNPTVTAATSNYAVTFTWNYLTVENAQGRRLLRVRTSR